MKRLFAFALLSALTLGAAGSAEPPRKNAFTQPHVLRFADIGDVTTLNPMLGQQLVLSRLSSLTMAWLFRFDHDNRPVPELAEVVPTLANGGISRDGLTITYHLRHGVKWSDGAPFSADDVVFSAHAVLDPKVNVLSRDGWTKIASIAEPDKYTAIFHLKEPYSSFIPTYFTSAGANPSLLPKHLLEHADLNTDPYNAKPVGIGPFRYVEWRRADRIIMEANPYYFRGLPKLKRIEYRVLPNRDTILNQLRTGEIDMWAQAARAYYPRLMAIPGFVTTRQPSLGFGHIDFNLARPMLNDVRVRRALAWAIDRKAMIDKVAHGIGILQNGVYSPASYFYDPHIRTTPQDVSRANVLLEQAGWKRGADGIRVKNGTRLSIEFVANTGSPDTDTQIEMIRGWWKDVGAELNRKNYDPALMFAQPEAGGIVNSSRFDAVNFAWFIGPSGDVSSLYGCQNFSPHGQNVIHWCNPRAQAAMNALLHTYDPEQQRRYAWIVQEQLDADVPTYVTYVAEDIYARNADLKNFNPNAVSTFDDFMNVDI